jgi:hypothetical protein
MILFLLDHRFLFTMSRLARITLHPMARGDVLPRSDREEHEVQKHKMTESFVTFVLFVVTFEFRIEVPEGENYPRMRQQ